MTFTNENALIASLMGSKVIQQIPRFQAVQNQLQKHVLPVTNFLPILDNPSHVGYPDYAVTDQDDTWNNDAAPADQFFPCSFSVDGNTWWQLPWEPMLNIQGGNVITKRKIAKAGKTMVGSIKERWSTDDYSISITGALYGRKLLGRPEQTYPRVEMEKLRDLLLTASAIHVRCEPLQILNINKIVIESMSFPFTKGENVQAYEISAISDFPYNLIYKRKKATVIAGDMSGDFER